MRSTCSSWEEAERAQATEEMGVVVPRGRRSGRQLLDRPYELFASRRCVQALTSQALECGCACERRSAAPFPRCVLTRGHSRSRWTFAARPGPGGGRRPLPGDAELRVRLQERGLR